MDVRSNRFIQYGVLVLGLLMTFVPTTQAATTSVMSSSITLQTSCDARAGLVGVTVHTKIKRLGYGVPQSDIITWTNTGGVEAGNYTVTLPKQSFGSTTRWVIVAKKLDGKIDVSAVYKFNRPAEVDCVAKQNPRFAKSDYAQDVNSLTCKEGRRKVFKVGVWVSPTEPGYIVSPGVAELKLQSGRQINGDGYFVAHSQHRYVEYKVRTGARVAKIVKDPKENGAWPVVTSSANVQLEHVVSAYCEAVGGR